MGGIKGGDGEDEDGVLAEGRPRRVMRIRRVFWWLAATLVGLSVLSVVAMAVTDRAQRQVSTNLERAYQSLAQFDTIQRLLLLSHLAYASERSRPTLAPFGMGAEQTSAQLDQALSDAHRLVDNTREADLLMQLRTDILRDRALLQGRRGEPSREEAARLDASLGRALETAERLTELNRQELTESAARLRRSARSVAVSRGAIAVLLLVLAGTFLVLVRRLVDAMGGLRYAIGQVSTGDLRARAPHGDLSEFRELSDQFNQMTAQLVRAREDRALFLSAVAHDLRTPLFALRSAAQLQEREPTLEGSRRRSEVIQRQVDRLNRMVEDLLDASRLETGKVELRRRKGDLREVVRDCVELFTGSSEKHAISAVLPDAPVWADFDETRMVQVLVNLLSNAIKYSPDGGDVLVALEPLEGRARLSVTDPGIGLTPEDRADLFVPFRRFSPHAEIPGVGLGLSVTRRLVEAHGGRIEVASTRGRGSTFSVILPTIEHASSGPEEAPGLH